MVVGLSAFHHDSAACILQGGELVGAVEEERFTRRKHSGGIPVNAFRWCLERAGATIGDIDAIAVGLDPAALADRRRSLPAFGGDVTDGVTEAELRRVLGAEAPIRFVAHHRAHAASAFDFSGHDRAAVLVVDGVGEWETTSIWAGVDRDLTMVASADFPHSLGLFYAAVTAWLGFRVNHDEYKVMGLAGWGEPSRRDELEAIVGQDAEGMVQLDMSYFSFLTQPRLFSERWLALLGPARRDGQRLTRHHIDVAASAQALLEDRMLGLARRAHEQTGLNCLCVAGGVGLNAVANSRLATDGAFDAVFFQPAAGDAGTALGAASVVSQSLNTPRPAQLVDLRLGPSYSVSEIKRVVDSVGLTATDYSGQEPALIEDVAELLADGRVVGWFNGSAEFGPRALGSRCLLADPRKRDIRDRINTNIKNRERWRPLAPIVAEEEAAVFFELDRPLRFMNQTVRVRSEAGLDAVTHIDGTARPQTVSADAFPRLAALLEAFKKRAGVPALVSTSFNHASEPIVTSPAEALLSAARLGLDALVLENFVIHRLPGDSSELIRQWQQRPQSSELATSLYPL